MLMHSRCENPALPLDLLYTSRRPDLVQRNRLCAAKYMVKQQQRMTAIHALVRKNLQASVEMQHRGQTQGGLKMREYQVGLQVWWYHQPSVNQKLKYPWTGPFEVTEVTKDRNVVRIKGCRRASWVHASSLKPVVKTLDGQLMCMLHSVNCAVRMRRVTHW